jgi:uncharacterized protein YqiB (DUF1249 family)
MSEFQIVHEMNHEQSRELLASLRAVMESPVVSTVVKDEAAALIVAHARRLTNPFVMSDRA